MNDYNDVWTLENDTQSEASDFINDMFEVAITRHGNREREQLKKYFESSWETIKKRFNTEGSVWYVWYMDGVNNFIADRR